MSWVLLYLAIFFEVLGTTNMKLSDGFSKLVPSILIFVFYGISFALFTFALKKLDISIAYAVWAGLGVAATSLIGVFFFQESMGLLKILSLILVISGVIGLNLFR